MREVIFTIIGAIIIIFILGFCFQEGQEREHKLKTTIEQSELDYRLNNGNLVNLFN